MFYKMNHNFLAILTLVFFCVVTQNKDGRRFHKILQALCKNGGDYLSKNRDVYLDLNKVLAKNLHECLQGDFKEIFP